MLLGCVRVDLHEISVGDSEPNVSCLRLQHCRAALLQLSKCFQRCLEASLPPLSLLGFLPSFHFPLSFQSLADMTEASTSSLAAEQRDQMNAKRLAGALLAARD